MKIKQFEKGLAEPVNELLPKLLKNDSNSESADAFEIILSLFTNSLSKLEFESQNSPINSEKKEFIDNSQINLFFKQLIKNINSHIPSEANNLNAPLNEELQEVINPQELIDKLTNLKNLSIQNTALNSKLTNILLNSLPNEVIQFLKDDKVELTSNTQNELIQIAKIFEKIKNSNTSEHNSENSKAKVVDLKDTGKLILENLENSTQLPHYVNTNRRNSNIINALSPTQISNEQSTLRVLGIKQPNQQMQNIKSLDITLQEITTIPKNQKEFVNQQLKTNFENTIYNQKELKTIEVNGNPVLNSNKNYIENSQDYLSENSQKQTNSKTEININEEKMISQEIKSKSNVDFLPTKTINITQKASNYSLFSSVRPNELPNYIIRMSNSIKSGGNYRAIMSFKPENLGSIFVNVTIKDDVLNIIIKADMNQTLEKIDSSVAQLKEALISNGFKSDNINLRIESNQTNGQNYTHSEKGFDNHQKKQNQKQELRDMIQKIRQYEHILSLVKQQEVLE